MFSASPDEPLIGVDPEDSIDVEFGGATFKLQTLPAGLWEQFNAELQMSAQLATRKSIAILKEAGEDPMEVVTKWTAEGKEFVLSKLDMLNLANPAHSLEEQRVFLEALRHSVKGHSKFTNRHGKEFPFVLSEGDTLDSKTTALYRSQGKAFLQALWTHVRRLNDLGLVGKKA